MTATPVPATAALAMSAAACPATSRAAQATTIATSPIATPRALPIAPERALAPNAHTPIATTGKPVSIDAPRNDSPVAFRITPISGLIDVKSGRRFSPIATITASHARFDARGVIA